MGASINMKWLQAGLWYAWCAALFAALLSAHSRQPNLPPPTREAFEERHRVSYDIYAASSLGQAYDLLAATFDGAELDRQYCLYAKAAKQLSSAGASVTVWDMLYQDFKVL